jgi:glycosyltransferase involved in cell wall biosynthesis
MTASFERDPFPGKPKILFVGLAESTHTHAWIDLLSGVELNVRLFALPSGCPPEGWQIRTYITSLSEQKDSSTRKNLYSGIAGSLRFFFHKLASVGTAPEVGILNKVFPSFSKWYRLIDRLMRWSGLLTPEAWLAKIIREWEPDIIHTLGLFDYQGGMFYYSVRKTYQLEGYGKWILQLRGGSDLTLRRHDPRYRDEISRVLMDCSQIISDNRVNIQYANELGVSEEKFASLVPVPGTGGLDIEMLSSSVTLPSKRERIVLWPKAYESVWSKAIPVLEVIQQAWEHIRPCEFHILAMTSDVEMWFNALPEAIKTQCIVYEDRIPRYQVLALMKRARVLFAPSLVDGIPNSLYEAMACGAFPIVSPLETIATVVKDQENVLFARNLYPDDMVEALIRAMSDDDFVDRVAQNNFELVRQIADRAKIAPRVVDYYFSIAGYGR